MGREVSPAWEGGLAGGELAGARAAAPRWGRGGRERERKGRASPEKNRSFTGDRTGDGVAWAVARRCERVAGE